MTTDSQGAQAQQPWQRAGHPIPVTTGNDFSEFAIASTVGLVSGVYATSLGIARGITASFSALAKGEVGDMTRLLTEARHTAMGRCVQAAMQAGANGLIAVRFDSNEMGQGGILEIHCYGTAVMLTGK